MDSFSFCDCYRCRNVPQTTLPENKDAEEHPITVVSNKLLSKPYVVDGISLNLTNSGTSSVWLNTLNYLHLRNLTINKNPLTFLSDIYTLHTLDCSDCKLKELPSYMPLLADLNCSNNIISVLPEYPSLARLNASNNIIPRLPVLPKLKSLTINNNPLTDIDIPTITYLEAYGCPLLVVYDIPGLTRRSSAIDTKSGAFKWITTRAERISKEHILIDWNTRHIHPDLHAILSKQPIYKHISKYLFRDASVKN